MRVKYILAVVIFVVCLMAALILRQNDVDVSLREPGEYPRSGEEPLPVPEAPLPASSRAPQNSSSAVRIAGRVQEVNGTAIAGASVEIQFADETLRATTDLSFCTVRSGEDGAFTVMAPNAALNLEYVLRAKAERFGKSSVYICGKKANEPFRLPPEGITDAVIVMQRLGLIAGRVVNLQSQPVSGVEVLCGLVKREPNQSKRILPETSDQEGRFAIPNLQPGEYALWGQYNPKTEDGARQRSVLLGDRDIPLIVVPLREGEWKENVEVRVPLDPNRRIEGLVVDEQGKYVAGAEVWAETPGYVGAGQMLTKTPQSGTFRVENIPRIRPLSQGMELTHVTLRAECPGYEPLALNDVPVGATDVRMTMLFERRGKIQVKLVDVTTGNAVTDAEVFLWLTDTLWGERRKNQAIHAQAAAAGGAEMDSSGWFCLDDVPAGNAVLTIDAKSYGHRWESGISVASGETTKRIIELEPAGMLCIHVNTSAMPEGWNLGDHQLRWSYESGRLPFYPERTEDSPDEAVFPCQVKESVGDTHRHFWVAPGSYTVQQSFTARSPVVQGESFGHMIMSTRRESAVIQSGRLTSVQFDVGNEQEASLAVTLPPDVDGGGILVGGPIEEVRANDSSKGDVHVASHYSQPPEQGVVPSERSSTYQFFFLRPGIYTLMCRPSGGLEGDWLYREVKLSPGEDADLTIESWE